MKILSTLTLLFLSQLTLGQALYYRYYNEIIELQSSSTSFVIIDTSINVSYELN